MCELVVPGPGQSHPGKLFDVHTMVTGPGRERTETEYADILAEAGSNTPRHTRARRFRCPSSRLASAKPSGLLCPSLVGLGVIGVCAVGSVTGPRLPSRSRQ